MPDRASPFRRLSPLLLLAALAIASLALGACTATGSQVVVGSGPSLPPGETVACAAGTMTTLDGTTCTPVGPTAIPKGFEATATGWGFQAIRSAKTCTGATRSVLGETSCVPVDDCNAPFPPPGAIVIRESDGPAALREAIATAPAGTTVAVDSGTYEFTAKPAFAMPSDVRVVGRCASQVIIKGAGDNTAFGFERGKLRLQSLTFSGFFETLLVSGSTATADLTNVVFDGDNVAIFADQGGKATLRASVVDGTRSKRPDTDNVRAIVTFANGSVTVEDTDFRKVDRPFTAMQAASHIDVRRSIVVDTGVHDDITVFAVYGGAITIEESSITAELGEILGIGISRRDNMAATDDASVVIRASEIIQKTTYGETDFASAHGGSHITVDESTIRHLTPAAFTAWEEGSKVTLHNTVITADDTVGDRDAFGASGLQGGQLEIEGTAILGAHGLGITVTGAGTRASIATSLVQGTVASPSASSAGGITTQGMGIEIAHDAIGTINGTVIADNDQCGLVVGANAQVDAESIVVQGTHAWVDGGLGHGEGVTLFADGSLSLRSSVVRSNGQVGLVAMRSSGLVQNTRFERNVGGVEVWETALRQGTEGDTAAARELVLVGNTFRETGDETKVTVEETSGIGGASLRRLPVSR